MTIHAIAGLFAFNLVLLLAGSCVLFAFDPWECWADFARLLGLAYLVGLSALGILLVLELTAGVTFGLSTIIASAVVLSLASYVGARLRGHTLPPVDRRLPATRLSLSTAIGVSIALVYAEAQFRSGRLAGLFEWDAMSFWVPKAKAIYYFGHFDAQFFSILPNASYPPLIPTLQASAFEFMGGPDPITLHLLFWFPFCGFFAAAAGLLAPRVESWILWPCVLTVALTPVVIDYAVHPLADLTLDYLVGLGALLVALWLQDRAGWQLGLAGIAFAAALLTKREGLLLVACVIAAAILASWPSRRNAWPRLVVVGLAACLSVVLWHLWLSSHHIGTQGPEVGYLGFVHHLDRAFPSLQLTLKVLYGGGWWAFVPTLVVVSVVAALLARNFAIPVFAGSFFVLGTLACSWVTLSFPSMPLTTDGAVNPIVRLTGALVIPVGTLLPLVISAAWRQLPSSTRA